MGNNLNDPYFVFRRNRARESLLLALHLHLRGASTYSFQNEHIDQLKKVSPTESEDYQKSLANAFTVQFIHFVRPKLLNRWGQEWMAPETVTGTAADKALVEFAQRMKLPLITNEGNTPSGVLEQGMRKRAREAKVLVYTPRDFYTGHLDCGAASENFLKQFRSAAPSYIGARPLYLGKNPNELGRRVRKRLQKLLLHMEGYYRLVFRGEWNGGDPLPIVTSSARDSWRSVR